MPFSMPDSAEFPSPRSASRRHWMAVLAKARAAEVEQAWERLPEKPDFTFLRRPESGLVMVRGRIGGTGAPFNLGEATATRCVVELAGGGEPGFAYILGRDPRHATLAAIFDALLQRRGEGPAADAIADLARAQQARRRETAGKIAASRVEFFTMVRE